MDAVLVIDKPAGMTSHDVVARVRRILGERSIGHLGTLDPAATGVLPLLIGRYTRLAQFYGAADKVYEGIIRLGLATTTCDAEGEPLGPESTVDVSLEQCRQITMTMLGDIDQTPPAFSAKKIGGIPAYKLARKQQSPTLKPVRVHVRRFEAKSLEHKELTFAAEVSAGTYIRSLAHDLGAKLGTGAHLKQLRRTASGDFTLEQSVTLERLAELRTLAGPDQLQMEELVGRLSLHPRRILPELPSVTVTQEVAGHISNGRAVNLPEFSPARQVKVFAGPERLIAVASRIAGTLFQPKVVLA